VNVALGVAVGGAAVMVGADVGVAVDVGARVAVAVGNAGGVIVGVLVARGVAGITRDAQPASHRINTLHSTVIRTGAPKQRIVHGFYGFYGFLGKKSVFSVFIRVPRSRITHHDFKFIPQSDEARLVCGANVDERCAVGDALRDGAFQRDAQ